MSGQLSRQAPGAITGHSKPWFEGLRDIAADASPEALRDLVDRIAALTPDVGQTGSTDLVRADRGG
jgi:hypothetical protein